jgi:predicted enzyme related to lactoylglutathione lyase
MELKMFLGLRTAIYPAPDLAAAKNWYSKVLETEPYFNQPFYVGFNVGGFELGGAVIEPVTDVGEGIKVAAIQDPFGNRLGIIQHPNFNSGNIR